MARPAAHPDIQPSIVARKLEEIVPSRPAYFWWLLANALALCFAIVSWFVCLHVFGNPEIPRNYEILGKLKRLPILQRFTVFDVPNGNAFAPPELYRQYFGLPEDKLARVNTLLLRNYLMNFERSLLLTYIEGDYQITDVRALSPKDFISQGLVVRAQALVKPDDFTKAMPYPVFIEYLFPTAQPTDPEIFKKGDILTVKKTPNCAAVVHAAKVVSGDDPVLLLTVIPIAYGAYGVTDKKSITIEPPLKLNPAAGFPIIKE